MQKSSSVKKSPVDSILLILVLLLVFMGLMVLFSASEYNGRVRFHDSAYYFKKQLFATALGLGAMYAVSSVDYHIFIRMAPAAYLLSLILSTAVILFLVWQIEKSRKKPKSFWFLCRTMLSLLPVAGLVGSNNLSTAIIILGIGVILVFSSSPGYMQFIGPACAGVGFIGIFLAAESYRLERLAIWRNPEKYEKGFQTIQGLYAIGSGGLFGRGFGNGIQKLGFVPEAQNDMIFSIICEEFGLTGAAFLIIVFGLLLWRLCVISLHSKDLSGALVSAGIMGHLAIQVILNIAVVTNTIPNTGITLPFFSYGGTSVMFLLGEIGLALNISRQI